MMIKEKIIFWPLFAVFLGILGFGFLSQGKNKEAQDELMQDIEVMRKNVNKKMKSSREKWDLDEAKKKDDLENYRALLKRSPFFRVVHEEEKKKVETIPAKKEPKKPQFAYKGKVMMGSKVMVIIEDHGTGKSLFVQEGDMIGDYLLVSIDDAEVVLKKKGGEDIVLKAVKKPGKEDSE